MANDSTIHIKNLKLLLTEIYKIFDVLSPPIMKEVFQANDCPYDLKNPRIKHKSTIKHRVDIIAFKGPATLLKKRLCAVNFAKFLRTPFLTEHLRWLLLNMEISLRYLLVFELGRLIISNINLYHLFVEHILSCRFSPVAVGWSFVFGGEI